MDRVKFDPLERADLEDIKALTDLGYEYDQRALGALLGAADLSTYDGGLLSGPLLTYAHSTGLLTLSSFSFLEITAGGAPLDSNGNSLSPEARVIRFDSSASSHVNSPVDISGARTVGTTYTLYARSIQVASDTSARRRWDISSSQEVSYSPTTRYRERVEFAAAATKPAETTSADVGQWAPLLTYEVDSSGVLTHTPISALDASDARSLAILEPTFSADTRERLNSEIFLTPSSTGTESRALGLNGLLSVLKFSAWRAGQQGVHDELYTPTSGAKWYSTPDISLGEARQRIERLETRNQAVQDRASELETVSRIVIRVLATWSTSANTSYFTTDAPQGTSVVFDGAEMSGAAALNDAALTSADFEKALRRPVVVLPTPASGKAWKVWSHQITPLTSPDSPDSLTDTGTTDNQPREFGYAVIFGLPSGDPPLSTNPPPTQSLVKAGYSISPATAPSTPTVYGHAVPFIIRMDPALVSSELKFIYDIQLTIQEVDA